MRTRNLSKERSMFEPQKLVRALSQNFVFIREMLDRYQQGAFSFDEAVYTMARVNPDSSKSDHIELVEKLRSNELLINFARSDQLQINDDVRIFIEALMCEYQLGLIEELHGYIKDVRRRVEQLEDGYRSNDSELFEKSARLLDGRLRHITRYMEKNEQAIADLVTDAKSRDTEVGAEKRYEQVLEAWDLYLDPLVSMVKPEGEFSSTIDIAKKSIIKLQQDSTITGHLISHSQGLSHVIARTNDLIKLSRDTLQRSVERVKPLKNEIRQNSAYTKAIAGNLRRFEKGQLNLDKSLAGFLAGSNNTALISSTTAIEQFYERASEFESDDEPAIDLTSVQEEGHILLDFDSLIDELKSALPVSDLMVWLNDHYGHCADRQLIRAYYKLKELQEFELERTTQRADYYLQEVIFETHSCKVTGRNPE